MSPFHGFPDFALAKPPNLTEVLVASLCSVVYLCNHLTEVLLASLCSVVNLCVV
jgi:hypothetical protein